MAWILVNLNGIIKTMNFLNKIKQNWSKILLNISILLFSVLPLASFAACTPGTICDPLQNRYGSIPDLIKSILEGALKIGIPLVALAVIYSGFLFVAARGNSEKLGKAKDALLYTLIGAGVLLGSWAIAQMISATVLSL